MKKNLLFLALALVALSASAQQNQTPAEQPAAIVAQPALRFGYFSFEQVFHTMPGYAIAKHNMDELRAKYDEETKRVETEFNTKYEEFLDGQRSYAKTILEKRQAELRELMEKNIAFKAEAAKLLNQADRCVCSSQGTDQRGCQADWQGERICLHHQYRQQRHTLSE